jgi:cell volume regulation protein A
MDSPPLEVILLLGAVVLLTAIVAVRFSDRLGFPALLGYLAIGLLLQSVVRFDDAELARNLGLAALVLILADGGLTTRWDNVRDVVPASILLATVGVGASMAITAVLVHSVFGGDWQLAFLIGAIVSSTDAAAVFAVLRRLRLPARLGGTLEFESGLNDPPAIIAVLLLSGEHSGTNAGLLIGLVIYQLVAGALIGIALGWLAQFVLRHVALPASGLYPVAVLAVAVGAYGAATMAESSGFLAAFACGIVLGNSRLPHRPATRGFSEGVAWLAQIGLFVMLGLLVTPSSLPQEFLPALAAGAVLLLVSRPISAALALLPLRLWWPKALHMNGREFAFLSWAGLRGAVPIVLATVPVTAGVSSGDRIFALVFVLVVVFTIVQGPSLPLVARKLGVVSPGEPGDLGVEIAPLEIIGADLLQMTIPSNSRLHGVELFELRLPRGSAVSLVVRDGVGFVPHDETELRSGDSLLIVTTANTRLLAERRLRAVSRRGRLAAWYGEEGR